MAKGVFSSLKGLDAFGKVSYSLQVEHVAGGANLRYMCADHGRCEGQDAHRSSSYVAPTQEVVYRH